MAGEDDDATDDLLNALGGRPPPPAPHVTLLVFHAAGGETVRLAPGVPITIGRRAPATVPIPDPHLSRRHARFTLLPRGRVRVEDLGSANGTWVADRRVSQVELGSGDEVLLGRVLVRVQEVGLAASATTVTGAAPLLVGAAMDEILATATRIAGARLPVIVLGETGTGKELVARFIHEKSPRRARPMLSVNCAAIPTELVESTLFGHERGAFTGAGEARRGVFEEADGGTVFLDEIGDLPLSAQAALLRVLETQRFPRVGSTREVAVDVRVIAATHRDLERMSAAGGFRADLYYRLAALVIALPPLRERPADVEVLARHFLQRGGGRALSDAALARVRAYAWPGNVRELRNAMERAMVLARGELIEEADLPAPVRSGAATLGEPPSASTRAPAADVAPPTAGPGAGGDFRAHMVAEERRVLLAALEATGWNRTETARRLGLPVRTLSHRLSALGIKRER